MIAESKEHEDFRINAQHVRIVAEHLIKRHFGERCDTSDPDCLICRRWALLDNLLENPYYKAE